MNSNANPTPDKSRPGGARRRRLAVGALAFLSVPAAALAVTLTGDTLNVAYSSNSVVTGYGNGAFGSSNTISNYSQSSVAIGSSNVIDSSFQCLAVGYSNDLQYRTASAVIGYNNTATANRAAAIGQGLISDTQGCVVVGSYNNPSAYSGEAFVVGVGTDSTDANGLVVLHNGDVIVPKPQGDISMGSYD